MPEMLNLVSASDVVVGYLDKDACHDGNGMLHRAFSVLLFDRAGRLLLQRRSANKRLWGRYWSNSCCSHPRRGEQTAEAAERRVFEELGARTALCFLYKFEYRAQFADVGAEHELCHVFAGLFEGPLTPDPREVSDYRMSDASMLDRELAEDTSVFTPWFKQEWVEIRRQYWDRVKRLVAQRD